MSVAKIIEVSSSSKKSFEDAVSTGIARVSQTVSGVQGAWIQEQKVVVSGGKITEYRVQMKVTFVLAESKAKPAAKKAAKK
jgi:flavin-binding protein dodecin